jgi:hypothetical protein
MPHQIGIYERNWAMETCDDHDHNFVTPGCRQAVLPNSFGD